MDEQMNVLIQEETKQSPNVLKKILMMIPLLQEKYWSTTELAQHLDMTYITCHRYRTQLEGLGFVFTKSGKKYKIEHTPEEFRTKLKPFSTSNNATTLLTDAEKQRVIEYLSFAYSNVDGESDKNLKSSLSKLLTLLK